MPKLAAVVLAAGASDRFVAKNKLLACLGGRPLVRCVAEEMLRSDTSEVVVVTGCDRPLIESALSGLPVRLAPNAHWQSGMGSSIAAGVAALGEDIEGAFIVPADMPFLSSALLRSLATAFARLDGRSIVYPTTPEGAQRNPVLWPRRFFPELMALSGPDGAKQLLRSLKAESTPVIADDGAVFADVDTRADLEAAQGRLAGAPQ